MAKLELTDVHDPFNVDSSSSAPPSTAPSSATPSPDPPGPDHSELAKLLVLRQRDSPEDLCEWLTMAFLENSGKWVPTARDWCSAMLMKLVRAARNKTTCYYAYNFLDGVQRLRNIACSHFPADFAMAFLLFDMNDEKQTRSVEPGPVTQLPVMHDYMAATARVVDRTRRYGYFIKDCLERQADLIRRSKGAEQELLLRFAELRTKSILQCLEEGRTVDLDPDSTLLRHIILRAAHSLDIKLGSLQMEMMVSMKDYPENEILTRPQYAHITQLKPWLVPEVLHMPDHPILTGATLEDLTGDCMMMDSRLLRGIFRWLHRSCIPETADPQKPPKNSASARLHAIVQAYLPDQLESPNHGDVKKENLDTRGGGLSNAMDRRSAEIQAYERMPPLSRPPEMRPGPGRAFRGGRSGVRAYSASGHNPQSNSPASGGGVDDLAWPGSSPSNPVWIKDD